MMRRLKPLLAKTVRALAVLILLAAPLSTACAHHLGVAHEGPPKGLSTQVKGVAIPNLTHGQMLVIAANRAAILKLAAAQTSIDPTLRRLQGYISLQTFACLWGLVPGAVEDESSPFNECSHAYLAGTKALLMHLLAMPGDRAPVRALADTIELEMMRNNASLDLCRYSDEPFDTADIVGPHWSEIPSHPKSALSLAGVVGAALSGLWLAVRPRRQAAGQGCGSQA
jgi:hypothetical protein